MRTFAEVEAAESSALSLAGRVLDTVALPQRARSISVTRNELVTALVCGDNTVRVFDVESGHARATVQPVGEVNNAAFADLDTSLLAAGQFVSLWDVATVRELSRCAHSLCRCSPTTHATPGSG